MGVLHYSDQCYINTQVVFQNFIEIEPKRSLMTKRKKNRKESEKEEKQKTVFFKNQKAANYQTHYTH